MNSKLRITTEFVFLLANPIARLISTPFQNNSEPVSAPDAVKPNFGWRAGVNFVFPK